MDLIKTIDEIAFHRNGIGGHGFYAIRFTADTEPVSAQESEIWGYPETAGLQSAKFLGILFDEPGKCAVICTDLIDSCGVRFAGGNSWRGDLFEPTLRDAIKNANDALSGGVRVGPFCVPVE